MTVAQVKKSPSTIGETYTTYNLEIANSHTYFVGESGIWVHNLDNTPCDLATAAVLKRIEQSGVDDPLVLHEWIKEALEDQKDLGKDINVDRHMEHVYKKLREENFVAPTSGTLPQGIRSYVRDIEVQTGRKLHSRQVELLKDNLRSQRYSKLSKADTARHRRQFDSVKDDLIAEWERQTGQSWPRYTENLPKENGKPGFSRLKGDPYDAHHVIENELGGPAEWWNIHPARFPGQHQGGIHRSGSPLRQLLENID